MQLVLLLYGVQLVLMVLGLMSFVTSIIDMGSTEVSLQLRELILPMCLFHNKITLLELVLMVVHRKFIGSLVLSVLTRGNMSRC